MFGNDYYRTLTPGCVSTVKSLVIRDPQLPLRPSQRSSMSTRSWLLFFVVAVSACSDGTLPSAPPPPPPPISVAVAYCIQPAWVAFQDGEGAWTQAQPTPSGSNTTFRYEFSAGRRDCLPQWPGRGGRGVWHPAPDKPRRDRSEPVDRSDHRRDTPLRSAAGEPAARKRSPDSLRQRERRDYRERSQRDALFPHAHRPHPHARRTAHTARVQHRRERAGAAAASTLRPTERIRSIRGRRVSAGHHNICGHLDDCRLRRPHRDRVRPRRS